MIEADTPTLWEISNRLGRPAAVAILVNAFIHAAKLVNLDKNLTIEQIGEAANDTLDGHGQLKVEEVKYLLKRAMRTQNVYGRFDYNVLMNWIEEYDAERTEEAVRLSEQRETAEANALPGEVAPGAISMEEYMKQLREKAAQGDEKAAQYLAVAETLYVPRTSMKSEAEKHREFRKRFMQEYFNPNKDNG